MGKTSASCFRRIGVFPPTKHGDRAVDFGVDWRGP